VYKKYYLHEEYDCSKHIGISREDTMSMPVWERRNYLQQLLEEVEEEKKEIDRQQNSSSGKRRVSA